MIYEKNIKQLTCILIVLIGTSPAHLQSNKPPNSVEKTLTVSVLNKNRFLTGLTEKDFEVCDGKTSLQIASLKQEIEPASIGILVDLSGSMGEYYSGFASNQRVENRVPWIVDGLIDFVNEGQQQNDYFILTFAKEQKQLLDWSNDKGLIQRTILGLANVKPKGDTKFYEGLFSGMEKVLSGKHKKVIIVVSDGMDDTSRKYDFADLKNLTKQRDVILYFINLQAFDSSSSFPLPLERLVGDQKALASYSGGTVYAAQSRAALNDIFSLIGAELRSHYKISFFLVPRANKNNWYEIKVRLAKDAEKNFKDVSVRTKKGLYL